MMDFPADYFDGVSDQERRTVGAPGCHQAHNHGMGDSHRGLECCHGDCEDSEYEDKENSSHCMLDWTLGHINNIQCITMHCIGNIFEKSVLYYYEGGHI